MATMPRLESNDGPIYDIPGLRHAVLDFCQPLLTCVDSACSLVRDYRLSIMAGNRDPPLGMGSDREGRL